jgi:hypothetical protein
MSPLTIVTVPKLASVACPKLGVANPNDTTYVQDFNIAAITETPVSVGSQADSNIVVEFRNDLMHHFFGSIKFGFASNDFGHAAG